jgi:COMPASS component SWD2
MNLVTHVEVTPKHFPQIIIYDCERGTQKRALNSKKYGVDLIHFTQHKNNVVHASTKENDIIRYLNVEGNKYISYFRFTSGCFHLKQ